MFILIGPAAAPLGGPSRASRSRQSGMNHCVDNGVNSPLRWACLMTKRAPIQTVRPPRAAPTRYAMAGPARGHYSESRPSDPGLISDPGESSANCVMRRTKHQSPIVHIVEGHDMPHGCHHMARQTCSNDYSRGITLQLVRCTVHVRAERAVEVAWVERLPVDALHRDVVSRLVEPQDEGVAPRAALAQQKAAA